MSIDSTLKNKRGARQNISRKLCKKITSMEVGVNVEASSFGGGGTSSSD
jgi:hypothetical protein